MAIENDIVLIYFEDSPLVFARIEQIQPDHKPGWYQVTMLLLQLPLQTVTWILRDAYINGEPYTMDGKKMRLEKVTAPEPPAPVADEKAPAATTGDRSAAKVISLTDLKKKR